MPDTSRYLDIETAHELANQQIFGYQLLDKIAELRMPGRLSDVFTGTYASVTKPDKWLEIFAKRISEALSIHKDPVMLRETLDDFAPRIEFVKEQAAILP